MEEKINVVEEREVKAFDVYDRTLGCAIVENLESFEDAESAVIAHDKRMHADYILASLGEHERIDKFNHHRYLIYHAEGKIITYADSLAKMSFADLCDEAAGWRAISVVEFKF